MNRHPWMLMLCLATGCGCDNKEVSLLETATSTPGPVSVQAVSEMATIEPGRPFRVGVWIRHEPGVHTYWKFPGVVGLPTSLEWELPEGFEAGELQWPVPVVSDMAGHRVWGYENDILLWATITPPADLKPGTRVDLKARASWMACGKTCHPGFKDLRLVIPVGEKTENREERRSLFAEADARMPGRAEGWSFSAVRTEGGYVLRARPRLELSGRIHTLQFFNSNRLVDSNIPQALRLLESGELELRLVRWQYAEADDRLDGVLFSEQGWDTEGRVKAVEISVPVQSR